MKIDFQYNKEKDIWCLLNKGKSSSNSNFPTKIYTQLTKVAGENPSVEAASIFIDNYFLDNKIDPQEYIINYKNEWDIVSIEFQKRAEEVFGVSLPQDFIVYLTVNNRCPYNIKDNNFFVNFPTNTVRGTIMHELWHFYTWYGLGADQEVKIGVQKYNDLKESLSVLLNVECEDLLPEGVTDRGYPQHATIREKILTFWEKDRNIKNLWDYLIKT